MYQDVDSLYFIRSIGTNTLLIYTVYRNGVGLNQCRFTMTFSSIFIGHRDMLIQQRKVITMLLTEVRYHDK